jgi:hypothetical protein
LKHTPGPRSPIIALRVPAEDLAVIEEAQLIMGDPNLSVFMRRCARMVAGAIIEAAGQLELGPGEGEWSRCSIGDARIVRKEEES